MLQQLIDNFRAGTANAVRLTSLAAVAALALLVSLLFLCAAAFVLIMQRYGVIEACLAEASLFLVVALIGGAFYLTQKRQAAIRALARQREAELRAAEDAQRAAETAQSTLQSVLTDPVLLAAGLQMMRSVGAKRLVPILTVAGIAIGFLVASRRDKPPEGL
jgi:uncharacterized membrane protein YqjE